MAKEEVGIVVTVKMTCSLWDVIKFRLMGKDAKKALFEKFDKTITALESNPESNRLQ